jgi:hypothetical protein
VYHSNGLSLVLLGHFLRVANFYEKALCRFNDIQRGVPLMSSISSQRRLPKTIIEDEGMHFSLFLATGTRTWESAFCWTLPIRERSDRIERYLKDMVEHSLTECIATGDIIAEVLT